MKTPLTYYGGKQQLASTIISLIPAHKIYAEPFIGGAAVYFAKEPSSCEVINDTNGELINFYEVMKRDFSAIQQEVEISIHSRKLYDDAAAVYQRPHLFSHIKRAWAVWMMANTSYGAQLGSGFAYDRKGKRSANLAGKREAFTIEYGARLQNTQIECCDALRLIRSRDTPETFFYCDPPYVGADQGHYDGYNQDDFNALLNTLSGIQGKFILSSYRNKSLSAVSEKNGWDTVEIKLNSPMTNKRGRISKSKIEVLTANYPIRDKIKL